MAMEIYALSDRRLSSLAEWQRAIDNERFPFPPRLSVDIGIDQLGGFLPAQYDGVQSGFECDQWPPRSVADDYPGALRHHPWKYALAFRFGIRRGELECAWMAATAYARATGGVVFDTEEGRVFQPDEAAQLVRKIEGNRALRAKIGEAVKRKSFPQG